VVVNGRQTRIWCTYEVAASSGDPTILKSAIKITEDVRAARLRRPFVPSVTRDSEISGFALHVTSRRGFWALTYQPRGVNPTTGKRWGGGTRHELGDAHEMSVKGARAAALKAKGLVKEGHDPHRAKMNLRASVEAARSTIPATVAEVLISTEN
jgi:hypothetical protein